MSYMNISAADVKSLRDKTNLPMMECKAALIEAGGNMEKAIEILRKKHKDAAVKRGERETAEGRIVTHLDTTQQVGVILEMRCESAPVAKSEPFIQLCNDVARHIAVKNPASVEALLPQVTDRIHEVIGQIRENMKPQRFVRLTGGAMGSYIHHDGTVGVLLQVEGTKADPQLLRDICMHITARPHLAIRCEDVSADTLAKEKEIALAQMSADPKMKDKPANILEKIVEGKLKTWFADNVLLEQPFVKDDSKTIGDLLKGAGLKLVRFVRYKVGELS
jgi:elongation factor Ts